MRRSDSLPFIVTSVFASPSYLLNHSSDRRTQPMSSYSMFLALALLNSTQFQKQQPLPLLALLDDDLRPSCVQLSRDGKKIAVAGGSQRGGPWKIFNLMDGKCLLNGLDSNTRLYA